MNPPPTGGVITSLTRVSGGAVAQEADTTDNIKAGGSVCVLPVQQFDESAGERAGSAWGLCAVDIRVA